MATPTPGRRRSPRPRCTERLVVRRVRTFAAQGELLPDWRYFAFATNRVEAIEIIETEHRDHAVVETHIADLKDGAGPLPLRRLQRQLGLGSDRVPSSQPRPLPGDHRSARPAPPRSQNLPPPLPAHARTPDTLRAPLDPAPTQALALARRLRRRARADQGDPRARLSTALARPRRFVPQLPTRVPRPAPRSPQGPASTATITPNRALPPPAASLRPPSATARARQAQPTRLCGGFRLNSHAAQRVDRRGPAYPGSSPHR